MTEEFEGKVLCDFDLASNEFAWVNETTQHLLSKGVYGDEQQSQLYAKKTVARCREASDLQSNLLGGRTCVDASQCVTYNCVDQICKGRADAQSCSSHKDCDAGLYCDQASEYPFLSKCKILKTSYEQCTDTSQCQHHLYCWYAAIGDTSKKCLPVYSQQDGTKFGWGAVNSANPTYEDYRINGKYCKSGLAHRVIDDGTSKEAAECISVVEVKQDNKKLESPYECDPTDNDKPCMFYFTDSKFYSVPCKCSLDVEKTNLGFCSSVMGTPEYKSALSKLKDMHEKSLCHTLDRDNFNAQKDQCSSVDPEPLEEAITGHFKITYWPYVQNDTTVK